MDGLKVASAALFVIVVYEKGNPDAQDQREYPKKIEYLK